MDFIRIMLKLVAFILATSFYYFLIVAGNLFKPLGLDHFRWSTFFKQKWGKAISRIIGLKISVIGSPPSPPFFLVSNHLSYIDVWVLYSQLKCTFIAKSDVKDWPVAGFVLKTCGVLFVDRGRRGDVTRVNDEVSKSLTNSQGVILFPEGTTSAGADILPFKSSLLQYPAENELPLHCATLRYDTPVGEIPAFQSICWWDDTPFFKHFINVLKMKEFSATVTFSGESIVNSNRKELARSSEDIIRTSFEPVVDQLTYAEANTST